MIHHICGPIGAGKTTYARQLARSQGAVCFTEDEWLANLYTPEAPEGLFNQSVDDIFKWVNQKYDRCRSQIWRSCVPLLKLKIPVIFDGAGITPAQRDAMRENANKLGVGFQLHYIDAPANIRRQRIAERNQNPIESFSLEVPPAVFEAMEYYFSPPSPAELRNAVVKAA